jgi:SH3-like domain-containing protein
MSLAQAYCVTKPATKLRAAPDGRAAVSWKAPKFMPLQATGKKQGMWIEVVDLDGQQHWAHKNDLSKKLNCIVVKVASTKLRAGPGKKYELVHLGVVDKYASFLDLGGEDGWTQVQDESGEKAWLDLDHTWKPAKKLRMSFESQ